MKRPSLRARFLLVLIILMLAVFGAISLLIVRQDRSTLRNNLITQSKSFASLATQPIGNSFVLYRDSGTIRIQQEIESFTDLDHDIQSVEITDTNGAQLFNNGTSGTIHISDAAASAIAPTYLTDKNGNTTGIVQPYLEGYGIHRFDVVYGISYQSANQSVQKILTSILVLSASILMVSVIGWYFFINRLFLRPVARISQIALQISRGDLDRQVHLNRSDEIGDLAAAVDTMASSLKADITKLKQVDEIKSEFLMITAHNLRTPLTIIEGYIDQLRSGDSPNSLQTDLDAMTSSVKRLGLFAEDALTISTMEDSKAQRIELKPTEMAPILTNIAKEFTDVARQKKLQFTSSINTDAWVKLSSSYFHSALWNLLDNAYKFTSEGGVISLEAVTKDGNLDIKVTDNGIGISDAEIPRLFTKFHRGTSTLNYNYEGTGIGLYLTKLITEQHGGTINLTSQEGHGSSFVISLPTVPAPPAE